MLSFLEGRNVNYCYTSIAQPRVLDGFSSQANTGKVDTRQVYGSSTTGRQMCLMTQQGMWASKDVVHSIDTRWADDSSFCTSVSDNQMFLLAYPTTDIDSADLRFLIVRKLVCMQGKSLPLITWRTCCFTFVLTILQLDYIDSLTSKTCCIYAPNHGPHHPNCVLCALTNSINMMSLSQRY